MEARQLTNLKIHICKRNMKMKNKNTASANLNSMFAPQVHSNNIMSREEARDLMENILNKKLASELSTVLTCHSAHML